MLRSHTWSSALCWPHADLQCRVQIPRGRVPRCEGVVRWTGLRSWLMEPGLCGWCRFWAKDSTGLTNNYQLSGTLSWKLLVSYCGLMWRIPLREQVWMRQRRVMGSKNPFDNSSKRKEGKRWPWHWKSQRKEASLSYRLILYLSALLIGHPSWILM